MIKRITLTLTVMAALCMAAFTLGGASAKGQGDSGGIPAPHPLALALQFQKELGLSKDQIDKLTQMRSEMAKELKPLQEQAEALQGQMEELQQSGKLDSDTAKKLQSQGDLVGSKMKPLFDRYAQLVGPLLSDDQRRKLMKLSEAHDNPSDGRDFVMMFIMQSREPLGIKPQQFTKLQYLQADFIREFAPLREQMELLQIEMKEKFGEPGKEPSAEFRERMMATQSKVMEVQTRYSDRAVKEVLQPNQVAKLEVMLHGNRKPEPTRG